MASDELTTVRDMLSAVDLDRLTVTERRAAAESMASQPPRGTSVDQVDAGGVPHVWHAFAGLLPEADQAIERIGAWLTERIPAS